MVDLLIGVATARQAMIGHDRIAPLTAHVPKLVGPVRAYVGGVSGADSAGRESGVRNSGLRAGRTDHQEEGQLARDHAGCSPVKTSLPSLMLYGPRRLSAPSPSRMGAVSLGETPASTSMQGAPVNRDRLDHDDADVLRAPVRERGRGRASAGGEADPDQRVGVCLRHRHRERAAGVDHRLDRIAADVTST